MKKEGKTTDWPISYPKKLLKIKQTRKHELKNIENNDYVYYKRIVTYTIRATTGQFIPLGQILLELRIPWEGNAGCSWGSMPYWSCKN